MLLSKTLDADGRLSHERVFAQAAVDGLSATKGVTVLTIAHRLHTIIGYDTVLAMEGGKVCRRPL